MAEQTGRPTLKQPPGYRDPKTPSQAQTPPPNRKPVTLPPSFYHTTNTRSKRRKCCCRCCCCLCVLIVALFMFLAVSGTLFYLWFTPRFPDFHVRQVDVGKFNVTPTKDGASSNYLYYSEVTVRVEARNPNERVVIYYGDTTVSLTADEDVSLGSATVSGFAQGTKNVTLLKFVARVTGQEIDDVIGKMVAARVKSHAVVIDAEAKTKVGLGFGSFKVGMLGVNVICGDVTLKELNNGDPPKCTLNTLKWINLH